jgi:hypothetical protein
MKDCNGKLTLVLVAISWQLFGQDPLNTIASVDDLQGLDSTIYLTFTNSLHVHTKGGHLQGIQKIEFQKADYYIVTGSTDAHSYYTVLKYAENSGMVISNNLILEKPFKHAGGFQIYDDLMAIGVEDNDKKNRSKVFIYRISNPEQPPQEPLAIIERFGTARRGTAGCVAITQIGQNLIVVVGDWDTVNLDFYVVDREKLGKDPEALILEYSLNTKKVDKSEWIDKSWLPYQNINLISDKSGQLWLAGMTTNKGEEDILDLYLVSSDKLKNFTLKKVYTRKFGSNDNTKFRWGAGLYSKAQGIQLLAVPENITEQTVIQLYE